jgi:hypothetical protein
MQQHYGPFTLNASWQNKIKMVFLYKDLSHWMRHDTRRVQCERQDKAWRVQCERQDKAWRVQCERQDKAWRVQCERSLYKYTISFFIWHNVWHVQCEGTITPWNVQSHLTPSCLTLPLSQSVTVNLLLSYMTCRDV